MAQLHFIGTSRAFSLQLRASWNLVESDFQAILGGANHFSGLGSLVLGDFPVTPLFGGFPIFLWVFCFSIGAFSGLGSLLVGFW